MVIDQLTLVLAAATARPYLDSSRTCHAFYSRDDAEAFISTLDCECMLEPEMPYELVDLMSLCFENGALLLIIHKDNKEEEFPLVEKLVKPDFYNTELNANIALLKQTHKSKYLKNLSECAFIVPAKVVENNQIMYGIVKQHQDDKDYKYLLFSDRKEYDVWSSRVEGWQPLLVNFTAIRNIAKGHGFILNPFGNRVTLTTSMLRKIPAEEEA